VVVGWAMADHMRASFVGDALTMALEQRRPGPLVFHSDRGSQYTSGDYATLCRRHGVTQSMSRPGQCWDNVVAESFFAALKNELVYRSVFATRAEARQAIFEYIEGFYDRRRRHKGQAWAE